jgi:hypothetical protein
LLHDQNIQPNNHEGYSITPENDSLLWERRLRIFLTSFTVTTLASDIVIVILDNDLPDHIKLFALAIDTHVLRQAE